MIELTLDRTKELLAEAVTEKGEDFVYANPAGVPADSDNSVPCLYVHGDQPGCVAGYVLHKAGVPLADLAQHENSPVGEVMGYLGVPVEDAQAATLLRLVQEQQDSGVPWGVALDRGLSQLGATCE